MSRRRWLTALLALTLTAAMQLVPGPGATLAATLGAEVQLREDYLPRPPGGVTSGPSAPLYERYPVWHYVYGAGLEGSDAVQSLLYTINVVQVARAWLLKLALRTVDYALRVDLVGPLVDRAGRAMNQLVGALWEQDQGILVTAGLAVAGILALAAFLFRSRPGAGLRILGGAAVMLVGSYALFAGAPDALANSAGVAQALGQQVFHTVGLIAPAGPGGPEQRLVRGAGEKAWQALVLDPWRAGEFTPDALKKADYQDGEVAGGAWLARTPTERMRQYANVWDSTLRRDFVQGDAQHHWDFLPRRLVLMAVSGTAGVVYAGVLLLTAGGIFYYQLLLLAMLGLAPVWLVVALWHPGGLRILRGAVVRAVGALVAQVVLAAVLAVLLLLTPALWVVAAPLGWMAQGLLMALLAVVMYRYRFRWLSWGREVRRREMGETTAAAAFASHAPASGAGTQALAPPSLLARQPETPLLNGERGEAARPVETGAGGADALEEELRLLRDRLGQVGQETGVRAATTADRGMEGTLPPRTGEREGAEGPGGTPLPLEVRVSQGQWGRDAREAAEVEGTGREAARTPDMAARPGNAGAIRPPRRQSQPPPRPDS